MALPRAELGTGGRGELHCFYNLLYDLRSPWESYSPSLHFTCKSTLIVIVPVRFKLTACRAFHVHDLLCLLVYLLWCIQLLPFYR